MCIVSVTAPISSVPVLIKVLVWNVKYAFAAFKHSWTSTKTSNMIAAYVLFQPEQGSKISYKQINTILNFGNFC